MSAKNTNTVNTEAAFDPQTAFAHLNDDGLGGFDALNADTIAFPFIRVLQAISPQCKRTQAEYLEGAEEGLLFNNITNRLMTPPVEVVVGRFDRYYTEWKPKRGGLVAVHMPEEIDADLRSGVIVRNDRNRIISRTTGNEFADTFTYYVVFPQFQEDGVCLLCLSSTQLKEARRWNRLLISTFFPGTTRKALPYHMRWRITTPAVSNDQGDWAGFKVEFAGFVTPEQLAVVSEVRRSLPAPDAVSRVDFKGLESGADSSGLVYDVNNESPAY